MQKRGQLTIIIVLGLVLFIMVLFGIYALRLAQDAALEDSVRTTSFSTLAIEEYAASCLRTHLEEQIVVLADAGGLFAPGVTVPWREGAVREWAADQRFTLVTPQSMADALEEPVLDSVVRCLGELPVEVVSGVLEGGVPSLHVDVQRDAVVAVLDYPLVLSVDGAQKILPAINVRVPERLGLLNQLGIALANDLVAEQPIDVDALMFSRGDVFIEVDRPYPHVVVSIKDLHSRKDLALTFAVRQADVFAERAMQPQGCCRTDLVCAKGVDEQQCLAHGGVFSASDACTCPALQTPPAEPCVDCLDCSTTQKHGDSWCVYQPGVGGRFYDYACVDGVVKIEPCADFKVEVCAQSQTDGILTALCRKNRDAQCGLCTTQDCCEDPQRDCMYSQGMCLPKVPRGSPFWQDTGVCATAPPTVCLGCDARELALQQLMSCSSVGDCGISKNIYGEVGGAFYSSSSVVDNALVNSMLEIEGDQASLLSYHTTNPDAVLLSSSSGVVSPTRSSLLLEMLGQLWLLQNYSVEQYTNTSYFGTVPAGASTLACAAFTAPQQSVCGYCNTLPVPCTQYACESLGQSCSFELVQGVGTCVAVDSTAQPGSVFALGASVPAQPFSLRESPGGSSGLQVITPLRPAQPIMLHWRTSVPMRCGFSALPDPHIFSVSVATADAIYATEHSREFKLGDDLFALEKLQAQFSARSYRELLPQLVEFSYTLRRLAVSHPQIQRFSSGYLPLLWPFVDYYVANQDNPDLTSLIGRMDEGLYTAFIHCHDRSGVYAPAVPVGFSVDDSCVQQSPLITKVQHTSSSLLVFTDTLSECRVSAQQDSTQDQTVDSSPVVFASMEHVMRCPTLQFDQGRDGYLCVLDSPPSSVAIQCRSVAPSTQRTSFVVDIIVDDQGDAGASIVRGVLGEDTQMTVSPGASLSLLQGDTLQLCTSPTIPVFCGARVCEFDAVAGSHIFTCQPLSVAQRCPVEPLVSGILYSVAGDSQTALGQLSYDGQGIVIGGAESFATCSASVDGIPALVVGGRIPGVLQPGSHAVSVVCTDAFNQQHSVFQRVAVGL